MKAWELMYKKDVLKKAKEISEDVKIIENKGDEFVAEIEGFKVKTYIEYGSPSYPSCNCSKIMPCKHTASLIYYLQKHPELITSERDLNEIIELINPDDLKKFLLKELKTNSDLKKDFQERFNQTSVIDKNYYTQKLSKAINQGKSRDFEYHEIYNLDMMENSLSEFLNDDIDKLIDAREHDFACELLCKIGDLLDDDLASSHDSWYDLSQLFMHYVFILENSTYLDSEKMRELNSKTGLITDIITVF